MVYSELNYTNAPSLNNELEHYVRLVKLGCIDFILCKMAYGRVSKDKRNILQNFLGNRRGFF